MNANRSPQGIEFSSKIMEYLESPEQYGKIENAPKKMVWASGWMHFSCDPCMAHFHSFIIRSTAVTKFLIPTACDDWIDFCSWLSFSAIVCPR
jgi:hypothetical protein